MAVDYSHKRESFVFRPIPEFAMQDTWCFEDILDTRRFATVSDVNAILCNTDIDLPDTVTDVQLVLLYKRNADVLSLLERIPKSKLAGLKQTAIDIIIRYIRGHECTDCPTKLLAVIAALGYPCDVMENCVVECLASVEEYKNFFIRYFEFVESQECRIVVLARRCAMWMHMAIYHRNQWALVGLWLAWVQGNDKNLLKGLLVTYTEMQRDYLDNVLHGCLLPSLAKIAHRTVYSDVQLATPVSAECSVIITFESGEFCRVFACLTHDACVNNIAYLNQLRDIDDDDEAMEKAVDLLLYLTYHSDALVATFGSRNIYVELFPFEIDSLDLRNKHRVTLYV